MAYQTLLVEDKGPVRIITLNQPAAFNPLDHISGTELIHAMNSAGNEPEVRAVVLTGAGKAFAAGGNLRLMRKVLEEGGDISAWFREIGGLLKDSVLAIASLHKPVVCAMNGVAAGGGIGWALACDLIVASTKARFEPGYIKIAVCPDGGTSVLVSRLIGLKRAARFFMLAEPIDASTAKDWGMINEVVEPQELMPTAMAWAQELAKGPAMALTETKKLLAMAALKDLADLMDEELKRICTLAARAEFAEGIKAFFERREPNFTQF